jgi:isoleucyl-tRNA synthetase
VILDTKIYPELQAEGWARDFVRLVQSARKKADYNVTDRVDIVASISPELVHALTEHQDYIATETLAASLRVSPNLMVERDFVDEEIDQYRVRLHIERVA